MTFTSIEWLALVLIVLIVIKILVILVNPKAWMSFAKGIYKKPAVTSFVALVLAAVVLYYLIQSGLTIVQILAVTVFVALLFVIGLASEVSYFIKKYEAMIKKGNLWREYWLYTLVWVVLIVWGAYELFR
ncbi:MAG: hypothetical protein KKB79_03045 [Nanoarchaeota archaeon]|nr:hypothetical protein [Nanoarchaeota archaeon]